MSTRTPCVEPAHCSSCTCRSRICSRSGSAWRHVLLGRVALITSTVGQCGSGRRAKRWYTYIGCSYRRHRGITHPVRVRVTASVRRMYSLVPTMVTDTDSQPAVSPARVAAYVTATCICTATATADVLANGLIMKRGALIICMRVAIAGYAHGRCTWRVFELEFGTGSS